MWYIGGDGWIEVGGKLLPLYSLRHTESADGFDVGERQAPECSEPNAEGTRSALVGRISSSDPEHIGCGTRCDGATATPLGYATSPDGLPGRGVTTKSGSIARKRVGTAR